MEKDSLVPRARSGLQARSKNQNPRLQTLIWAFVGDRVFEAGCAAGAFLDSLARQAPKKKTQKSVFLDFVYNTIFLYLTNLP
jgi:hypothetical protein